VTLNTPDFITSIFIPTLAVGINDLLKNVFIEFIRCILIDILDELLNIDKSLVIHQKMEITGLVSKNVA
jgi:hypothetical protein